ncbi:MFS transporter [Citrobacter portucalensis]|uniref:MFS transporter n=1 Tax=Citrobacter portucalensis TaxID=1639133 RepID=UPI00226B8B6C|nr:MFS transporter [Citrobacter portucalensis]MCX9024032.1 MFS transporter [Citrobacter portucalensis]MCX9059011.1 MFS transporter [Citrobacter portucalensis]
MKLSIRWGVAWLLFFAGVINYLDRTALSIVAPLIEKDLSLTSTEMGIIFSSFFFGYALFCAVGGYAADRFGPTKTMKYAMGLWSFFCGLTAAASGFLSLLGLRVLFGMSEGPLGSTFNKTVNNWFPQKETSSAVGFANAGTPLGGAIAGPVVGLLAVQFGWRVSFLIIMLFGFIWLLFWRKRVCDFPQNHPDITAAELKLLEDDQKNRELTSTVQGKKTVGYYLRQPTVWATAVAFFTYNYLLVFFLSWFPLYLTKTHGLNIHDMSIANAIPWICGALGMPLGGYLCDRLFIKTGNALKARKTVLSFCLLISACCISSVVLIDTMVPAVILMSVTVFFLYGTGAIYWSIIQDTVQKHSVGSISGVMHLIGNAAGVIGPTVTGIIIDKTGSFSATFFIAGGIAIAGTLIVLFFIRPLSSATSQSAAC